MENITTAQPWQVVFFGVGCLVVGVVIWVWLNTGVDAEPVDFDPATIVKDSFAALLHWRSIAMSSEDEKARFAPDEPEPARSNEIPLLNGQEPQFSVRSTNANAVDLHLNAEEMIAVTRMIEHNKTAVKPSKTNTIQAGFGVSRGGGEKYQRASLIYDALFGVPAPAVNGPEFRQPDGTTAPATRPVTGKRTAA
jgi:hypothetical protein